MSRSSRWTSSCDARSARRRAAATTLPTRSTTRTVFEICRAQVEDHSYQLLEAIGESDLPRRACRDQRIERVTVTVRKPGVPIDGVLEHAGVRLERSRS